MEIGLNLYSIRTVLEKDYFGTLEHVASMGYRNIEMLNLNRTTGKRYSDTFSGTEVAGKLAELGLNPIAVHESIPPDTRLTEMNWDFIIDYNLTVGCRNVVIPALWFKDREQTLEAADQLNAIGQLCRKNGAQLYYHNHFHEFTKDGDHRLFDLLVERTDPSFLKFELDLVWVMRGGQDPVEWLKRLGGRCDMIHQKDVSAAASPFHMIDALTEEHRSMPWLEVYGKLMQPHDFVDLEEGIFHFQDIYPQIRELGTIKYAIVENEGKKEDRMAAVSRDLQAILKYI
ncbi:sugar phosphate isomerase/epimerase family protein [Paenibacillaceae bacterium WGS1546]|uniref:sugar phosphate isomerase/epimerase family protein n=1 Tax=Cohnella sp. WGS1546 TaxID=3366810 RepID=UPI00372D3582